MKNKFFGFIVLCIIAAISIGVIKLNQWMQSQMSDFTQEPVPYVAPQKTVVKTDKTAKKKRHGEVICKVRLAPERTYELSKFYQGGDEIASYKELRKGRKIIDQKGEIPDGKVKFINESNRTYCVMYFEDNLRNGPARTNYEGGELKSESYYQFGKLITRKEYYINGILKMEEDYSDARDYGDDRKSGIGKTYWRDGTIKYEWHMTNSDPTAYTKSYNSNGSLTSTVYFDEYGNEKTTQGDVSVSGGIPPTGI